LRVSPQAARNRLLPAGLAAIFSAASRARSSAIRLGRDQSLHPLGMRRQRRPLPAAVLARLDRALALPALHQLVTKLTLTSNLAAVARRDAPTSTERTTRWRRSTEYGRVIHGWPPRPSPQFESQQPHVVNPKSIPSNRIML